VSTSSLSSTIGTKITSSANVAIRSGDVAVWYFGPYRMAYGSKTGRIYTLENNTEISMASQDVDSIRKDFLNVNNGDELLVYGKDYQIYIPSGGAELDKYSISAGIKCRIRIVDIPKLGNISLNGV